MSNLKVLPEHRHLEVLGTTCFNNNEWIISISIVGLVGKHWNVFVDGNTGQISPDCEFNSDYSKPHQYSHLPDYLNQLIDRLTVKLLR